ncbi:hypothetical protein NKG05_18010 [Oerskovia sp. M15]
MTDPTLLFDREETGRHHAAPADPDVPAAPDAPAEPTPGQEADR